MKRLPLLCLLVLALFLACSDKSEEEILNKNETVSLLVDLHIAEALFDTGHGSTTGFQTKKQAEIGVLNRHGVTQEKYRKTLEWYGRNLDRYEEVNKEVNKKLQSKLAKVDPKAAERVTDENNVWPYPDHLLLSPFISSDGLSFIISNPEIDKGGYTEFKAKTNDLSTNLSVLLGVEYEDGSMTYTGRSVSGFPDIKIRVQTDSAKVASSIFGYLRPAHTLSSVIVLDSVSLIKMPFDSLEYYRRTSQTDLK